MYLLIIDHYNVTIESFFVYNRNMKEIHEILCYDI